MKKKKHRQTNPYAREMKENPLKAGAHKVKTKEANKNFARTPIEADELVDHEDYDMEALITYLEEVIEERNTLTAKLAELLKKEE